LPSDFAKAVADALGWKLAQVDDAFDFEEDKEGFFWAKLKPKKFLENLQFRAMCSLVRDLGGEDYLKGAKAWKIPGPCAKKPRAPESSKPPAESSTPSAPQLQDTRSVVPDMMKYDKSKPPYFTVPVNALLSMPFQCRLIAEDPDLLELTESVKTYGVLEPVLVRPKPDGLYEIVAGERRVRAAVKARLIEVPVNIKSLTDEEAFVVQLTENLQRKDLSEEEKSRALGELARRTGWNAQQIADKLKMSERWVYKYLPQKLKDEEKAEAGRLGGQATAEAYSESQDFGAQRAAESEETRQTPELPLKQGMDSEAAYKEVGNEIPEEEPVGFEPTTPAGLPGPEPAALKAVQIGEFDCTECGRHFFVDHLPDGDHKLREVKEMTK
jgi:ParB/RepB/Spo0J family partition protein